MDLADGVADSAAEAGQPGCSALHLGHGALEPGLKAGEDTKSPNPQPHLISKRTGPPLSCAATYTEKVGKGDQPKGKRS